MGTTISFMRRLWDRLVGKPSALGTVDRELEDELGRFQGELPDAGGIASRKLASEAFEIVVEVRADPVQAAVAFSDAMARLGRLVDGSPSGPERTVSGVIGSGFMDMNPAVVEVRIAPRVDGRCVATLTGTAKEGLVKQRTGEKAVRRVLGAHELAGICGPEDL